MELSGVAKHQHGQVQTTELRNAFCINTSWQLPPSTQRTMSITLPNMPENKLGHVTTIHADIREAHRWYNSWTSCVKTWIRDFGCKTIQGQPIKSGSVLLEGMEYRNESPTSFSMSLLKLSIIPVLFKSDDSQCLLSICPACLLCPCTASAHHQHHSSQVTIEAVESSTLSELMKALAVCSCCLVRVRLHWA